MTESLTPFVPELLLRARKRAQWTTQWQIEGSFVFADISGFTKLSEQLAELGKAGAEELTVLLNATFESLLGVATAEGGDLVKFGGDALFLFFGGDEHAERACRAAHGMRAALKTRGAVVTDRGRVVLRISMGVHSGPFLFVLAGTEQRELFVLGEHATTVTNMESAADAGEILVSEATAALLPPSWRGAPKGGGVLLKRVAGVPYRGAHPFDDEPGHSLDADILETLVPRAIRRRLADDEHGAEHRRTTVAFVHVGGVDDLLRDHGPDTVAERLDHVVSVAVEAADRHEVTLLATDVAGGGIKLILTAGVPDSVEDGEGRMLAVGRALIDADVGLPVRVGVNTGHVFAGEVGAPWRRVYTVMGDAVNLSARLMAKAAPGELVASNVTLEQSATPFETAPLEPFMVKGKRHPQHAATVGKRIEGRGRDQLSDVGFVGRAAEMQQLTSWMFESINGVGGCVEVLGEAGIGKSRLVRELISTTEAEGVRVVRITCEPFASDRPYFMARVLLRTAVQIPLEATAHEAGGQLIEWLDTNAPELLPYAPLLAVAIDAEVPSTQVVDDLGTDYRVGKLREVSSSVLHLAFSHPLLLVVEDAMWMDEASAAVFARALQHIANSPWFGCLTTRDRGQGLDARLGFDASFMELAPLESELAERLAAALTDEYDIPHDELLALCARANGNPLFLLELAHARREVGSLDAIPGSLEDLIGARIDRLTPSDRNLLRHAAVLGDRFAPKLFDRTLGDSFPRPVPWQRLSDFVMVDQGELRFTHDLVRRVAYAGLPFRLRRELHHRIGRALIPRGEPDDARLGLLALHFEGSGDGEMAWRYNRLAGQRAWDNYATIEATSFFERAIGNAKGSDGFVSSAELASVYEALADVALLAGRFDLAREGLRGARKLCGDDPGAFARLCRKEGKLRERLGQHAAALRWFRRGLRVLDESVDLDDKGMVAERAQLETEWASLSIIRQRYRPGVQWCRRALPRALEVRDRRTEAHLYYLLEWALGALDDDEALTYRTLARPIYEELGDYVGLGALHINWGVDALDMGRWHDATSHFVDARAAYQRAGDVVTMAQASHNLAEVLIEQGRHDEAESYLRESRRIWRASGFAMGMAAVDSALGRTMARSGRPAEGVELIREAQQRFIALEHTPFIAESAVRLAEAFVFGGRWSDAIDVLDEIGDQSADGGPAVAALGMRMRAVAVARSGHFIEARELLEVTRVFADKQGVEWESALAALEIARLPDTPDEAAILLESLARQVLESMGVRVDAVLPPVALDQIS
jgi:class 3 adenylate cyclase/tetratricopeptide (TPR) repeat protein